LFQIEIAIFFIEASSIRLEIDPAVAG